MTKDHKGKEGKDGTGEDDKDDGKAAAAKKKAEIKKRQEAAEAKKKKLEDPLERTKSFLSRVPSLIRDLQLAMAETKSRKTKACVPPRFLKEFEHSLADHHKVLLEVRSIFELNMCSDQKKYVKKVGLETIEKGESNIAMPAKTLKSWRSAQHVYQNGIGSGENFT